MPRKKKRSLSEDNKIIISILDQYRVVPGLLPVTMGKLAISINIDHRVICEMLKLRFSTHFKISSVDEIETLINCFTTNSIPHLSTSNSRKNKPKNKKVPKPWFREVSTAIESNRRKH